MEYLLQQISLEQECIANLRDEHIIGSFLLSSKYFESSKYTQLKPSSIQEVFPNYSIDDICKFEFDIMQKLEYKVDKLLMGQYNYWQCTDQILLDLKSTFGLNDKWYRILCQQCQEIALKLMYFIGNQGIKNMDEQSLAVSIILCGYQQIKPFDTNLNLMYRLGMTLYICTNVN